MTAVHRAFFPLFALLENPISIVGAKVVAQRKLLFLEKLIASLLLATPRIKEQLNQRISSIEMELSQSGSGSSLWGPKQCLLSLLRGMRSLLLFFLPAIFRVGYLVRCCTWEGRARGTGATAKDALEQIFVLLVHLLGDTAKSNNYVRSLSVALFTWRPFFSQVNGVCYAEEPCEALLGRLSHRCETHRHLTGFESTFDLFLSLAQPSRVPKGTRGTLKAGLVSLFASRIRRVLFSDGKLPFAQAIGASNMHSEFQSVFPDLYEFPQVLPPTVDCQKLTDVLQHALRVLVGKAPLSADIQDLLETKVGAKDPRELRDHENAMNGITSRRVAKPRAKPKLMPKPRALPGFELLRGKLMLAL